MREDELKWARHGKGDEAGKRGYRSFYVVEKKLLLLIYAPLKCFCSSKKGNNTSVYSMIQTLKRRKDTTRGLFCKTTNKTNGVCFMLSLQMRLNGCACVCDSFTPTYISWISWGEVITQGWCGASTYRKNSITSNSENCLIRK